MTYVAIPPSGASDGSETVTDLSGYVKLDGRVGGQTISGGTDANEDLALSSTEHATKGDITIGGVLTVLEAGVSATLAGNIPSLVVNATANDGLFDLRRANTSFLRLSTGATNQTITANTDDKNLVLVTKASGAHVVLTGTTAERQRIRSDGDVVIGDGNASATVIATTATSGFLRVPTCAGPPTGAAVDGSIVIDTTNHKIYFRSGGTWRDGGP